jgi:hypothetical protein
MYIGHIGLALGGKGIQRHAPMWLLIFATQGADWAQAVACVAAPAGSSAMWSHSIPAVTVLALGLAAAAYQLTGDRGVATLTAALTLSHALADYITGVKPTWPGGPMIGLDMYSAPLIDLVLETAVLVIGWQVYRRSLSPEARSSRLTWALLIVLGGTQLLGVFQAHLIPTISKCM